MALLLLIQLNFVLLLLVDGGGLSLAGSGTASDSRDSGNDDTTGMTLKACGDFLGGAGGESAFEVRDTVGRLDDFRWWLHHSNERIQLRSLTGVLDETQRCSVGSMLRRGTGEESKEE